MLDFIQNYGPVIVGLAGIVFAYLYNIRMLKQKVHEDERKEIYKKLNDFYGPVQVLLEQSNQLSEIFRKSKEPGFRTVVALLEGRKFEGNDKVLLEEIINIVGEVNNLILSKSGLIDDEDMWHLLARASDHFRILRLAYQGVLTGEAERFRDYVYPRELNKRIGAEISKLKGRLAQLNAL